MLAPQRPLQSQLKHTDLFRPISSSLKDSILEPYKQECVYIKEAFRDVTQDKSLVTIAEVCVPVTFYGSETGHFNAVESLLCLNQLAFLAIAELIVDDEPHELRKSIRTTSIHVFKEHVLTRTFITSVRMQYRRTLDGKNTFMRLAFTAARKRAGLIFLASEFAFIDGSSTFEARPAFMGDATFAMPDI
ncbi:FcoT-like thioesterase domain protein [Caballeronia temeraria]|uniref:(2E)-enoyl-[ACP] glycyltransferase n=1 Tax=Caballeronia temeraria TaxID=1777137 RepID=A0A158DC15_9BURK|nr:FcoT family thioesterase [Caballeronia temeraria]SAK92192.1 FcoT-like thioesterase domain protein [Caballeronia temeraria]